MPILRAALCFQSPAAETAVAALIESSHGCVTADWYTPEWMSYTLTDEDFQHMAVQYGWTTALTRVRVLTLYIDTGRTPEQSDVIGRIQRSWDAITALHGVRGSVDADELRVYCHAFRTGVERSLRTTGIHTLQATPRRLSPEDLGLADQMDQPVTDGSDITWRQVFGAAVNRDGPVHVVDSITANTPTPLGNAAQGIEPTRDSSFSSYRRNRQLYGNMAGRRQQESAIRRAEQQQQNQWIIDWQQTNWWTCPGPNNEPVNWAHNIMEPKHLWDTICWLVNNYLHLFNQYHNQPGNKLRSLAAKQWLASQPAFRALVQEAVRRHMTFPNQVFQYLRDYVLPRDTTEIAVSPPWADPEAAHQIGALASFLDAPLQLPEEANPRAEFGRDYRDIDIDTE